MSDQDHTTVMIGIARMGSTRLPGKVLMDLGGMPVLQWIRDAASACSLIDDFIIATTTSREDDTIVRWCDAHHVKYYRGSEEDVLSRFAAAAAVMKADVAVRVTCDCPFIDPHVIDQVVALREATGADYASNIDPPTWPDGLDCEAITMEALAIAHMEATSAIDRNCVTTFIQRNRHRFQCETLICPLPGMHKERWVLDTENDYKLCQAIADNMPIAWSWLDIKRLLDQYPELRQLNSMHPRNERFYESVANEPLPRRSYAATFQLLERAERVIPLAAQTYSKSKIQYPADSPLFVTHGDGAYCFDVDGNRYVDLVGGLLPIILGHRDPDVDYAIRSQLNRGVSFSLSTELEIKLARLLQKHIPCAEMARFGKSGTDATSAAIRLARAYTGRDVVLSAGYHGWADWSVAHDTARNSGVPRAVAGSTVSFAYGDPGILHRIRADADVAAVIVEPEGNPEYLKELREVCDHSGVVLIFDEIITWPRWGMNGAQGLYGVTPDLSCVSKAMANGMPISALVGRKRIMRHMEKISYSGTFFGETLSIAAAIATINKLERENVIPKIQTVATKLRDGVLDIMKRHQLPALVLAYDRPPLGRLSFRDAWVKTLFIQEMAQNGVLIIASHNLSYAHGDNEVTRILKAYDATLGVLKESIEKNTLSERIKYRPIPAHANVRAAS